jgi:hypothetical protein
LELIVHLSGVVVAEALGSPDPLLLGAAAQRREHVSEGVVAGNVQSDSQEASSSGKVINLPPDKGSGGGGDESDN